MKIVLTDRRDWHVLYTLADAIADKLETRWLSVMDAKANDEREDITASIESYMEHTAAMLRMIRLHRGMARRALSQ